MKPDNQLLYTGDCTYLFSDGPAGEYSDKPFSVDYIHQHIDSLKTNGVDTYLCNPQAQANWWPSKRVPNLFQDYTRGDRDFAMSHAKCTFWNLKAVDPEKLEAWVDDHVAFLNRFLDLQEAGIDWVEACEQRCRHNGITPWLTVRMNDRHGRVIEGNDPEPDSYFNAPLFKNPENRLSGQSLLPIKGSPAPRIDSASMGMNYAREEVRQFILDTICELVEDYNYEGLQLDWTRSTMCLEPGASQKDIDMITDFHAQIRAITEAKAKATGKPFYLGMRLLHSFDLFRSIGIDFREIIDRGILDFICPNNGWQTSWETPHDEYKREFGDKVKIYGSIEKGANGLPCQGSEGERYGCRIMSHSPELIRANAAGKLALGAEGIEVFNFFSGGKHEEVLADLPDLGKLRGKAKQYLMTTRKGGGLFEQPQPLPVVLEPDWRKSFRVSMCEENDESLELVIQVVVDREEDTTIPGLRFNDRWPVFDAKATQELFFPDGMYLAHHEKHLAHEYRFPVSAIREGWNEIELVHPEAPPRPHEAQHDKRIYVLSIELAIMKKQN